MKYHRSGEKGAIPARSNRFFSSQGAWFFNTREGAPMGPFDDQEEAVSGLGNFLEFLRLAKPTVKSKLSAVLAH